MISVLVLVSPEAHSEIRIRIQTVYWGDGENTSRKENTAMEKGRKLVNVQDLACYRKEEMQLSLMGKLADLVEDASKLSPPKSKRAGVFIHQPEAAPRGVHSLAFLPATSRSSATFSDTGESPRGQDMQMSAEEVH